MQKYLKPYIDDEKIISAKGISKVANKIEEYYLKGSRYFNIIYDYIGSGFYIRRILNKIMSLQGIYVNFIDWYSFEYYILSSKNFENEFSIINKELDNLEIVNKEDYIANRLSDLIPYSKSYGTNKCLDLDKVCVACDLYKNNKCKYFIDTKRYKIYMHFPLIYETDNLSFNKQMQSIVF